MAEGSRNRPNRAAVPWSGACGRYVCLEVADDGSGMSRDPLPRIFDPFFSTKFAGLGLGLAAVAGIVRSHEGTILVDSDLGRGTTFRVRLPVTADAEATVAARTPEPAARTGHGTILLVDDEQTVRDVASLMLQRIGFEVVVATDGQDAVAEIAATPERFTAAVIDLTMPRVDGEAAFQEIHRLCPPCPCSRQRLR
jgi:two-component system cell cycle sensor histidine kinase/response regulator CckA